MGENTETIIDEGKKCRVLGEFSDIVKPTFSLFSYSSITKQKSRPTANEESSTQINNRIIFDDIVEYANWVGCVSKISETYFEVIAKSSVKKSTIRKFRIRKSYLKNGAKIQMDQIVRIKIKKYRQGSKPGFQKDIVVIPDKSLNRSKEYIDEYVARKMQRFAYMFVDDEKR